MTATTSFTIYHVIKAKQEYGPFGASSSELFGSYTTFKDAYRAAEKAMELELPFTRWTRSRSEIDEYDETRRYSDSDEPGDSSEEEGDDERGCFIRAYDEQATVWDVRLQRGKLHMPATQPQTQPQHASGTPASTSAAASISTSTAASTSTSTSSTIGVSRPAKPPTQYVIYEELYYSNGGIEKRKKKIHWKTVYNDLYLANTAARELMYEHTETFKRDKNAGSRTKPYSGVGKCSPMFYNDPVEVIVRVIDAQKAVGNKRQRVE